MNVQHLSNEALKTKIAQLGKQATSESTTRAIGWEKERMIYWKEYFRRGLGGIKPKRKYWDK